MQIRNFTLAVIAVSVLIPGASGGQTTGETIIRGGEIVTADGRQTGDIRIVGSTITEIGTNLQPRDSNTDVIDGDGLLVLPGGIDPHVHVIDSRADDYTSASEAALAGGLTTISNFVTVPTGETPAEVVQQEGDQVSAQTIADVILHSTIGDPATATTRTLQALADTGQPSIKIFMVRRQFDQNAEGYLQTLAEAGATGVLTMIHCEDAAIIAGTAARMMADGRGSLEYFPDARPVAAEVAATQRAVAMSETTGAPIYIVHLSSERALRVAEAAQARGLPVYVETRPIYLHLTRERFEGPTPGLYVGQPPLREQSDQDALWDGLARGTIQTVATDHVAYTREEKLAPQTVAQHRAGMSNLQVMLPMLYSDGVRTGRITIERFVEVTSTNAAKLFGLYPRKGTIAVGSDADLVLWDADETRTIRDSDMLSRTGYSVHAGREVTGWPVLTMRRGEVVYRDGQVSGRPGSGELLQRLTWTRPDL